MAYFQPNPYQPNQMYNPYQARLDQMQQYIPPQMQPPQPPQPSPQMKGYPVQSEEEARRAPVDTDGSIYFFPNLQSGELYTKQINTSTFDPEFVIYRRVEAAPPAPVASIDTSMFATREEVDALKSMISAMQEKSTKEVVKK